MHPEIEAATGELRRQTDEVVGLIRTLDPRSLNRRPAPERWSVAEHVEHLALSNRPYGRLIREAVEAARNEGRAHRGGPYRRKLLPKLVTWSLRPPPRFRMKTFDALEPAERSYDVHEAERSVRGAQEALAAAVASGDGLDLGRVSVTSPFARWLRFPVIQAVEFLVAHTDRHIWLMNEALERIRATER